jgi:[histone H3]-lysine79 N-trimethyltransferase
LSIPVNEDLKQVFLDLKDGTKIISLKPFGAGQVTERNIGAIESILHVETFEWQSGDVSWADATGIFTYFRGTLL